MKIEGDEEDDDSDIESEDEEEKPKPKSKPKPKKKEKKEDESAPSFDLNAFAVNSLSDILAQVDTKTSEQMSTVKGRKPKGKERFVDDHENIDDAPSEVEEKVVVKPPRKHRAMDVSKSTEVIQDFTACPKQKVEQMTVVRLKPGQTYFYQGILFIVDHE